MIFPSVSEIVLYDVEHRGSPNFERIPMYINQTVEASNFGVLLAQVGDTAHSALPILDHFFWFGQGILNAGDWIFLYTGQGSPKADNYEGVPGAKIYSVHWGKMNTIFANSTIVPVLFKIESLMIGSPPQNRPQLGLSNK